MSPPLNAGQSQQLDDANFLVALHVSDANSRKELLDLLSLVEKPGTEIERWNRLNRAQQAVVIQLPEAAITGQFAYWLLQARSLDLANIARFKAIEGEAGFAAKPLSDRRAALLDLVQSVQAAYRQRRSSRVLRITAARSLVITGITLTILAAGFAILAATSPWWDGTALTSHSMAARSIIFTLTLVVCFGLLGAFFSRLMTFQSKVGTLTLTEFLATYQSTVMWVRLLVGAIGALIFYFTVRAGLIAGTALPSFAVLPEFDAAAAARGVPQVTVHTEFAKLMIWSFLAGFSERLVSSSLDSIEARANKAPDAANGATK